jgi:endo-1,4-beta-xylanase
VLGFLISAAHGGPTLKEAFKKDFLVGAALNQRQFCESNEVETDLIKKQFNSISPENALKWGPIHPQPDKFNFSVADRYVDFGITNQMVIIGHNLIWHEQTPAWVFQDERGNPLGRNALLARMREHILTVVGRYRGKIRGWDVVNEVLNDDGTLRPTPWLKIIGKDYLVKAYQFAHEADPQAELYYNDYELENAAKRNGAIALIKELQSQGVSLTAVGLQGHYRLGWPSADQIDATLSAFGQLKIKVMITELDVDVLPAPSAPGNADISQSFANGTKWNPYTNGLPADIDQKLSDRYGELFGVFVKYRDVITRVTFWGVTDADSWLNYYPIHGRINYPLPFDRNGKPKKALAAILQAAQ